MVLFIMVRIRAPQPKIKTPLWRFCFWFVATVRDPQPTVAGSKTSRFDKHRAVKSSRFPRSRRDNAVRGNPCAPTTLRVCDASGGKPERNNLREGVPQPYFALRPDLKSLYYPTNPSVCIFHNFLYAPFARNNCLCVPVSTIFPF